MLIFVLKLEKRRKKIYDRNNVKLDIVSNIPIISAILNTLKKCKIWMFQKILVLLCDLNQIQELKLSWKKSLKRLGYIGRKHINGRD
ncbi:unnamed protein product [Paramecium sonneborni]|uniref:Uncharacterized protein n=1 Tax=Paramecium sonneborni TaxID=65129 RepID=A0A8S1RQK0_9CILI|nr:unnamed protein product [Paramecium sonneborni]